MSEVKESTTPNDEVVYEGEAAYQYAITEFIKENPLEKKLLKFYPDINDVVLGWTGFSLEEGEIPLIAVAKKPWFGRKKNMLSLLITNRRIYYRLVKYYFFDMFFRRKTDSVRWEDIEKLGFDYAYYNYKGGYMGSQFYVNGEFKGLLLLPELNWFLIFPAFCVDDKIVDWFQALFTYLAELGLLQSPPDDAGYPNAGDAIGGIFGNVLDRF
ncbi:MAG: hypothetical protein IKX40_13520 [Thermoguttaceae bacterium]|nr:hypothetical protein [Thermoguttaceae bacterium]